jgi:hypothetical protein
LERGAGAGDVLRGRDAVEESWAESMVWWVGRKRREGGGESGVGEAGEGDDSPSARGGRGKGGERCGEGDAGGERVDGGEA